MSNLIGLQYTRPPASPENIIYRERLCSLLEANKNKTLTIINASAGYGKTVLLAEYIRRNPSNHAWLTIPTNVESPAHFLSYLIHSLKIAYPSFGGNTLSYLEGYSGKWSKNNISELVTVFLNEALNSINSNITLIIDDFQNLENKCNAEWVHILFTELFASVPENLKFLISTRQTLLFKTSRLEAKRQLFVLTTADLCFDYEETKKLSAEVYNIGSDKFTENILKQTGGWITAMHMILLVPGVLNSYNFEFTDNIYNFIAEDIFSSIDDDLKFFLIKTAYLDTFDESFVNKLLNINNSKETINKLISKNIFLDSASSEGIIIYFYQKLFSDFLRQYVNIHTAEKQIIEDYLKIADTYIDESKHEESLWFLIRAGDTGRFIEIVNCKIEEKFDNLDFYTIEKWLSYAGDICVKDPHLRYYKLKYFIKTNKLGNVSISSFNELIELVDNEWYYKVIILKAEFMLLKGNLNEALELLKRISSEIQTVDIKKQCLLLLCKTYYRSGFEYYDMLTKVADEAIQYYDEYNIINEKLEIIGYLASINADQWNDLTAIKYYEMALQLEKDTQKTFIHLSNLVDLYSNIDNFERARDILINLEKICNTYPMPYFTRLLIRSKMKFYTNLGDYLHASKIWCELEQNVSVINNPVLYWNYYMQLTELHYYLDDKIKAAQYYALSVQYLNNNDLYLKLIDKFLKYYYSNKNLLSPETEDVLMEMFEYHTANKLFMSIPQIEFSLAKIHGAKGLYSSVEKYLHSALHIYREKKQTKFLEIELLLSRKLFDFAISQNIEKKFIRSVFAAIKNKLSLDFISDEYREELNKRIFRLTDLYLFPFGKTEIYLRGEPVPEDKWIRKKSKILLVYLMNDPGRIHTKDEIMDMFFDDMPAEKADVVYHSAIYNIRTALKIYDIKSDKPKRSKDKTYDYNPQYILYEDKTLKLNHDFYYKADNIEFEKLFEKSKLPAHTFEEKINYSMSAIELYKGDFLPGYYDSWCEELRVKYKNMYITLCEELIKILETEARYDEVIKYSELLLKEDKLNDSTHISIINAYSKLGNIKMAKSRYEIMLKIYDEELGEKPLQKTLDSIKSIMDKH